MVNSVRFRQDMQGSGRVQKGLQGHGDKGRNDVRQQSSGTDALPPSTKRRFCDVLDEKSWTTCRGLVPAACSKHAFQPVGPTSTSCMLPAACCLPPGHHPLLRTRLSLRGLRSEEAIAERERPRCSRLLRPRPSLPLACTLSVLLDAQAAPCLGLRPVPPDDADSLSHSRMRPGDLAGFARRCSPTATANETRQSPGRPAHPPGPRSHHGSLPCLGPGTSSSSAISAISRLAGIAGLPCLALWPLAARRWAAGPLG